MKLVLNLSLFLFALFTFNEESLSLTNFEIKRICSKKQRENACIKKLQEKRNKLQQGKLIKIPIIPYKR